MLIFEFDANIVSYGSEGPQIELYVLGQEEVPFGCLNYYPGLVLVQNRMSDMFGP
jgi:hypothetical protein